MANLIEHCLVKLGSLDNFAVDSLTQNGRNHHFQNFLIAMVVVFQHSNAQIWLVSLQFFLADCEVTADMRFAYSLIKNELNKTNFCHGQCCNMWISKKHRKN